MKSLTWLCLAAVTALSATPVLAQPARAAAPSFDCAKAASAAEKMVCSDPKLAALDRETERLYRLASTDPSLPAAQAAQLRGTQRGWIKGRDECWKDNDKRACVASSYAERVHELRQGSKAARAAVAGAPSLGPFPYHCAGLDGLVGVTFMNAGGVAYLQWKDRGVGLIQAASGPGARYEGASFDGKWSFWIQDQVAQLTQPGGKALACTREPTG